MLSAAWSRCGMPIYPPESPHDIPPPFLGYALFPFAPYGGLRPPDRRSVQSTPAILASRLERLRAVDRVKSSSLLIFPTYASPTMLALTYRGSFYDEPQ